MYYVFYCEDAVNSLEKRRHIRPAHIQRLQSLMQQDRLLVAGPLLKGDNLDSSVHGVDGSLMIIDFPSIEEARTWIAADPYVTAEVYAKVTIKPFQPVFE